MLHLFRNKSPYTVLILLILTLVLKMGILVNPRTPQPVEGYFLYNGILQLFNTVLHGNAFFYTLLSVTMIFLQGIYLNVITIKYRLFLKATYFPAFIYILFTSISPDFNYFSVPLLINWCMLIGFDIALALTHTQNPRKPLFNAAFAMSIAALLHFSAVGYFIVVIAAFLLLRPFNASEAVVTLMGYLTPIYFAAGILFIADQLPLLASWPTLDLVVPRKIKSPVYLATVITGVVVLFSTGAYAMQLTLPKATIAVRRSWILFTLYLFVSIAVAIFGNILINNAWILTIPALTLIIVQGLSLEKSKWFSNFIFYFSIVIVIASQVVINK